MKRISLLILAIILCFASTKAQYKFPRVDASVADIACYPLNGIHDGKPLQIKIVYSRPLKKDREVFGSLEKFGKVWRVGANESTEIKFYVPVTMGGKRLAAGTYSLFAIPEKDNWTIIINSNLDQWGLTYDQSKDIMRFQVPVKTLDNVQESFAMTFTDRSDGANLVMGWDKTAVEVPVIFNK